MTQPPKALPALARLHELLSYDPLTGIFRWKINRGRKAKMGDVAGCLRPTGYIVIVITRKLYPAHRLAWFLHYQTPPIDEIDHINGIKQDNRIENLREASRSQNNRNSRLRRNNTSGVKGVDWHAQTQKWRVRIHVNGTRKSLGLFHLLAEAEAAIKSARQNHHEAFARHS